MSTSSPFGALRNDYVDYMKRRAVSLQQLSLWIFMSWIYLVSNFFHKHFVVFRDFSMNANASIVL